LTVHPVPAPPSTKLEPNNKINAGGNNQNEMLFNLGNRDYLKIFKSRRTISSSYSFLANIAF